MAQSYFSIITPTDFINMDATLNISRTLASESTDFPVEVGGFASDNIVNKGDIINYSGVISDVKSLSGEDNPTTSDFIKLIEKIRNEKQLVSVNVGLDNFNFKTVTGCVLINAEFNQDSENGIAYNAITSYKVTLSFKKVRIIAAAEVSSRVVAIPLRDIKEPVPESASDETTTTNTTFPPFLNRFTTSNNGRTKEQIAKGIYP